LTITRSNLEKLIADANAKAAKGKRKSALKHRVTTQITTIDKGRPVTKFVTVYLTDEGLEQYTVCEWLRLLGINFTHPANESKRSPQEGFMLKLLGMAAGVSDLIILTTPPYLPCKKGVMIEMKSATGKPTPAQIEWQERAERDGFIAKICYSGREAINFLEGFGYGQKSLT
jgi:hypothetical protein